MQQEKKIPYDWIEHIKPQLAKLDEVPLMGNSPAFPWKDFTEKLQESFDIQNLTIKPGAWQWKEEKDLLKGIGSPLMPLNFSLSPFSGKLSFLIAEDKASLLMSWLLAKKNHLLQFSNTEILQGFLHFLALHCIEFFQTLDFAKNISPSILDDSTLPNEPSLCLDIEAVFKKTSIFARLVLSKELQTEWKKHFTKQGLSVPLSSKVAEKIHVSLDLIVGKTQLTQPQWKELKVGDLVLLDECSLSAKDEKKGHVTLAFNEKPVFRGKLKNGTIEIEEKI